MFGFRKKPSRPISELGKVIAGATHHGCERTQVTAEQSELLRLIELDASAFKDEIACLACFAAEWGIVSLLKDDAAKDSVRSGYWAMWAEIAAKDQKYRSIVDMVAVRGSEYATAAAADMAYEPGNLGGGPLVDVFSRFIEKAAEIGDSDFSELGYVYGLSSLTASATFDAYMHGAAMVLAEAGLIRRPN